MALTKVSGGILDPGINVAGIVTATGFDGPFVGGSSKNITAGIVTATSLDLNGNGDISGNLVIGGNLTANGDFTTLNTTLREVELLRVDANSTAVAGIITQRGSGDIFSAYDTSTEVFKIADGGDVTFFGATTDRDIIFDRSENTLQVKRNAILKIGQGSYSTDLYSDGTNTIFDHNTIGALFIKSNIFQVYGTGTSGGNTYDGTIFRCMNGRTELGYEVPNGGATTLDNLVTTPLGVTVGTGVTIERNGQASFAGIVTFTGNIDANGDLDVDGQTELDDLNVAGIATGTIFKVPDATNAAGATNHIAVGDSSDLKLYHDNNGDAYISNATGHLTIRNNTAGKIINLQPKSGANGVIARYEGAVELYHNGTKKFETQTDGCHIYGNYGLQIYGGLSGTNTNAQLGLYPTGSSVYSYFKGYKSDSSRSAGLTVYDGSNVYLDSTGTGSGGAVYLRAYGTGFLQFQTANVQRVKILDSGYVGIGSGTPSALLDVNKGTQASIQLKTTDSGSINSMVFAIGSSTNQIFSRGANSSTARNLIFLQGSTEVLKIDTAGNLVLKDTVAQGNSLVNYIQANDVNGAAQYILGQISSGNQDLYLQQTKNANIRFQTSGSTRWKIDGDPGHLLPEVAGAVNIGSASAEIGDVYLASSKYLYFGDSQNLEIHHTNAGGGASYIKNKTGNLTFLTTDTGEFAAQFRQHSSVDLYYDHSKKFATSGIGVTVFGEVAASQDYPDFKPALDLNFAQNQTLDPRITYSRVGSASVTDENGRLKFVGSHVPRFDHEPGTGKPRGLLVEAAGTNLMKANGTFYNQNLPTSTYFSNTNGAAGEPSTDILAPDGSNVTYKMHYPNGYSATTNGYVRIGNGGEIGTLTAGDYAFSFFVKRGTDGAHNLDSMLDNSAGLTSLAFTAQDFSPYYAPSVNIRPDQNADIIVEKYPDGWYRISNILFNANQSWTPNNTGVSHYVLQGSTFKTYYEAHSFYYWGFQLEKNPVSTSYIGMTVREQTTRAADSAVIEGENFDEFFNHNGAETNNYQGTLIASVESAAASSPSAGRLNKIQLEQNNDNKVQLCVVGGGTPYYDSHITYGTATQADFTGSEGSTFPTVIKHGVAFAKNSAAYSYNGNTVETDSTVNVGGVSTATHGKYTQLTIGGSPSKAHIRRVMYYSQRISNTQLRNLTS